VTVALALASPALADDGPVCGGAYAQPAGMVDAAIGKYGTLYSGGNHWQRLDTVGATLDLYRLWLGLPDTDLRSVRPPSWGDEGFEYDWNDIPGEEIWSRARGFMGGDGTGDPAERIYAAWGADALTSAGPAPDWWLHADDFPALTPTQRWVSEIAPTAPALDWLQVLLAASNTPAAVYGHLGAQEPTAAMSALADHAWGRFQQGDGPAWAVAAALAQPQRTARVDAWVAQLEQSVLDCEASAGDYAAWAVVTHGQDRLTPDLEDASEAHRLAHLPPATRLDLLDLRLMRLVAQGALPQDLSWWQARLPDDSSADRLSGRIDYVRAFSAGSVAALPPPGSAHVVRLLNGLSSEDLSTYSQTHGEDAWLVPVLYARAIALGDWDGAQDLLPRLSAQSEANAAAVEAALSVRGGPEVRLARVVLALDSVRLHICGGSTGADVGLAIYQRAQCHAHELPMDYAQGAAFDRDLEAFLRLPSRWRAFWGMRGASINRLERLKARSATVTVGEGQSFPTVSQGPFPISSWLDLTVADAASGPPVLMPPVAVTIVAWADEQSSSRRRLRSRRIDAVSESLGALIRRCRRTPCGQVDGRPAQQVAFELLHDRMPESSAAQQTPYWWASPER
jgi:hypothetical protein